MKRSLVIAIVAGLLSGGCADTLIFIGLLFKCGPMPMSASDCESKPTPKKEEPK